jgi:hypothetical protein
MGGGSLVASLDEKRLVNAASLRLFGVFDHALLMR